MIKDKAYKLLAIQEGISNSKAKDLIDRGLVYANNRKLTIARGEIDADTRFVVKDIPKIKIIFEDNDILAVDKPPFMTAIEVEKVLKKDVKLLNRLDKETSGVMLFSKNEEFTSKAISEFKNERVYKEYIAIVDGKVIDEIEIDAPILTLKGKSAKSRINSKKGLPAYTKVTPMFVYGNRSKVKVVIQTGRTHQIRVHLSHIGHSVTGDELYGKRANIANRVMLHSHITKIFDYEFKANEPKEFAKFAN